MELRHWIEAAIEVGVAAVAAGRRLPKIEIEDGPLCPTAIAGDHVFASSVIENKATSMPAKAQEMFGTLPDGLHAKVYEKSAFPAEWFDDREIVRSARRVVYAYKNRKPGVELPPEEMDRIRAAHRFMSAYERRKKNTRGNNIAERAPG